MLRVFSAVIGVCSLAIPCAAVAASPLQFVKEYISAINAIEDIRTAAEKDQAEKPDPTHVLLSCIRSTEAWKLELSGDINIMNGAHLQTGWQADEVPQDMAKLFAEKLAIVNDLSSLCSTLAAGPKPGVDYGALLVEMPKITSRMNYIDKLIFDTSPMAFMTLTSNRPDSQNHMSHLVITRVEKADLIATIKGDFGDRLDKPNQNYAVGIAQIFKDKLNEFRAADDPW
jgi:hypothetical protein